MSALNNRHWIEQGGTPITGRTPPELRVYGPEMTGDQQAQVRHIYKLFTDVCLLAVGDYQVRQRVLGDGTRVRCTSFRGRDVVEVWTSASEKDEFFGGFLFRPQDDFGAAKVYWGKPVTTLNAPLGTEFGVDPTCWLQTRWKKKTGLAENSFKVERFVSDQYGTLDWQGKDAETDVLSWNAMDLGVFTFSEDGTAAIALNTPNRYFAGDVSDPDLPVSTVRRYNSFGTGSKVFSRFLEIESFSGYVCGAARHKGRILAVTTTKAPYKMNAVFSVVTKVDGAEINIGSYTVPAHHIVTQCWYFSQTGNKARSVALGKYGGFAIEVTIEEGAANASGLVATFAVVEGSAGSDYATEDTGGDFLSYQTTNLAVSGSGTRVGGDDPNTKDIVRSLSGTATVSDQVVYEAGGSFSESPSFAVDFVGDVPVSLCVRQSGGFWDVSGSANFNHTIGTVVPGVGADYTQTWTRSATATIDADRLFTALVMRIGETEETIPLGSRATTRDRITETASFGLVQPLFGPPTRSGSCTITTRWRRGDYKRVLDIDLRYKAILFYKEGAETQFRGASTTLNGLGSNSSTTASFAGDSIVVSTVLDGATIATTTIGAETSGASITGYGGSLGGDGGTLTNTVTVDGFIISGMPHSGETFQGPDTGLILRCMVSAFYKPVLRTMRNQLFPTDNPWIMAGAIRTYYGQACSTGIIGDTTDQPGGTPEKFFAHVSDADEQNANVLVEIADKDRPWFFKLGVV